MSTGHSEHFENFPLRRRGRVRRPEAHGHGSLAQPVVNPSDHLGDLNWTRGFVRAIAGREESTGVTHHRHPDGNVTDADAVVDRAPWCAIAIPGVDICGSELELECGG